MSIVIDKEKYTALIPLIQTLSGFLGRKVQNTYTLKFSFESGFACLISNNTKNDKLSVHFENQDKDEASYLTIMNAIS
ncbi:hypothetical protein [Photobacterium iliopiscarium]|uniref:Uncharacterized protein n=1 Tax=Photobacterium iliopiscarium TaxID=56192 RepID=A0A2T3M5R2_9GAMM|nr:hypothetical protein [Photobacterium iliopiscarium]PSV87235.1 hypothetical protein C9I88_20285 [Photobacterium iliopiscarium]